MKIDWKRKLSSRKFWAAVIGFVTAILVAFGANDMTVSQVTAVISASSILIAYIFSEGWIDAANVSTATVDTTTSESGGKR